MELDFSYVDLNDISEVVANIRPNTAMIWAESPTNPLLELVDLPALVAAVRTEEAARRARMPAATLGALPCGGRILVCVDNTFATAWNQRPLRLGVDLVMLSTSKYIGGHSDMIGGALITADTLLSQRLSFLKSRVGAVAGPFDAYLGLRGLKTLALRMERQCSNAQRVAEFLEGHPCILEAHYPGLPSNRFYDLCQRQMRTGGAVVTVRMKCRPGEEEMATMRHFFAGLRYWVLAESLGGVESMINHSATMSHGSMTKAERTEVGVHDTTLRLSVGIEDVDDLIRDLANALGD